jgi:hypothetical protein
MGKRSLSRHRKLRSLIVWQVNVGWIRAQPIPLTWVDELKALADPFVAE